LVTNSLLCIRNISLFNWYIMPEWPDFCCRCRGPYVRRSCKPLHTIYLLLADPPKAPTISGWPTSGSVKVGDSLTLTCTAAATGGGTPARFEWYKGASKLSSTGTQSQTYTIASASPTDKGDYECKAINDDGERKSAVKTLDVKGRLKSRVGRYAKLLAHSTAILASIFSNLGSVKRPMILSCGFRKSCKRRISFSNFSAIAKSVLMSV